jgi:hypothetical protein
MNITKNHIGTGNYFWREVADRIKAQYSHGTMTEFDFKAITVFPLLHIAISRIDISESTSTLTYSIMIADQNMRYSNDFQGMANATTFSEVGYTEDENYVFVLQELYVRILKEIAYMEKQMYNSLNISRPFTLTPFIKDTDSILTGFTGEISLTILNPIVTDGWC